MRDRMAARLSALREADQFRDLTSPPGISLSSNDYLGLSGNPRLKEAIVRAVEEDSRVASTGSRLLSGNHPRWDQIESEFARFVGVEAALYFSSGYSANVGLMSSILKAGDIVFSDAANHASIIDGIRLSRAQRVIFPHLDLDFLEDALRDAANAGGERIVVVESLFSMEGDRAPIADLAGLCERYSAFLVVDEAHAVGVEGEQGRGLAAAVQSERILATVYTCGKALASMGAFVAGSHTLRAFLINHARSFIFSTALPPYCGAHVQTAVGLTRECDAERAHLKQLGEVLRTSLRSAGFDIGRSASQIVPVILGDNGTAIQVASALCESGFSVRAIRPPTVPAGSSRLRLSLNASLRMSDVERLVEALTATIEGVVRDS